jgi:single-stranded DNA-binding protein
MINKSIVVGTVADLKATPDHELKIQTSFTLRYEQPYGQGQVSKLFLPVDVLPSKSEAIAEAIADGDLVLVDGSLKWRSWIDKKSGAKQGKLAILAWSVSVLQPAAVSPN